MNLRRALFIAGCLIPMAGGSAMAQFQPAPPPQQQQMPPCAKEFFRLRDEAGKKAEAIRKASEHKASPKVACGLFNEFSGAEAKMIKYAETNAAWCGIPAQVIAQMKKAHAQTGQIRVKICRVAAEQPAGPRPPSLSDALGGPIPDANNITTGRGGTFDTLTGTPLGTK